MPCISFPQLRCCARLPNPAGLLERWLLNISRGVNMTQVLLLTRNMWELGTPLLGRVLGRKGKHMGLPVSGTGPLFTI